jgi:hypothetical protein
VLRILLAWHLTKDTQKVCKKTLFLENTIDLDNFPPKDLFKAPFLMMTPLTLGVRVSKCVSIASVLMRLCLCVHDVT